MGRFICFAVFTSLIQLSLQSDIADSNTYKAAVLEYSPFLTTILNLITYKQYIQTAAKHNVDIVVFPEGTLTLIDNASLVPSPEEKIIPFKNNTYKRYKPVYEISEAAAVNKIYVVVNLHEIVYCNNDTVDCPPRGYFKYNTNVAFDRTGMVVARYRKFNLYSENGIDKPNKVELSTFKTDFGVTFGMFTCFDILFKSPTLDLVRERNIKNAIFPTFWFGELPFLTAVQMQVGWSYSTNVTLLASGANKPLIGSTGSGIYNGRNSSTRIMTENDLSFLLESVVSKDGPPKSWTAHKIPTRTGPFARLKLKQDPSIPMASGKDLNMNNGIFNEEICHKEHCCRFNLRYRNSSVTNQEKYSYRAVVFEGIREFAPNISHEVAYCAVLLCTDGNCARKPRNGNYPLIFDEMKIYGQFKGKDSFQMPNTLYWAGSPTVSLDTLDYSFYSYENKAVNVDNNNVSIKLERGDLSKLITFGIFGRKFD